MLKIKWLFNYLFSLKNMSYVSYIFCLFRKKKENFYFLRKKGILCFLDQQGVCPCSYVSSSAIRKSDLCSSLGRKHFVYLVDFISFYFIIFWKICFNCVIESLRRWTLKRRWILWKQRKESLKALDLEVISSNVQIL